MGLGDSEPGRRALAGDRFAPGPNAADPSQDCETRSMPDPLLAVLSKRTGWAGVLKRLHDLYDEHGTDAAMSAEGYADRYKGRRAAMAFDAVASRQRKYELVVLPWVAIFDTEPASASLAALSTIGPSSAFHLRTGEAETHSVVRHSGQSPCEYSRRPGR